MISPNKRTAPMIGSRSPKPVSGGLSGPLVADESPEVGVGVAVRRGRGVGVGVASSPSSPVTVANGVGVCVAWITGVGVAVGGDSAVAASSCVGRASAVAVLCCAI